MRQPRVRLSLALLATGLLVVAAGGCSRDPTTSEEACTRDKALIGPKTTGGWAGREEVNGLSCDHLVSQDVGANWQIRVPCEWRAGAEEARTDLQETAGRPDDAYPFKEWNLAPQVTEAAFAKEVPAGYEGIAMIQRASVLLNMTENPSGDTATAPGKTGEARRQRTRQATAWDGHLGHDLKKLEISRGNFCSISVLSSPDKS